MASRFSKNLIAALSLSMALTPLTPMTQALAAEAGADEAVAEATDATPDAVELDTTDEQLVSDAVSSLCDDQSVVVPDADAIEGASASEAIGEPVADERPAESRDATSAICDGAELSATSADDTLRSRADVSPTSDFYNVVMKPSMDIKDSLDIKVNVSNFTRNTKPSDYSVRFWLGDDEASATTVQLTDKGENQITVARCAATQMTVPVHVRLYYKTNDVVLKSIDCTVRDFCDAARKANGPSGLACQHVLNYGAAAQAFFNYNTDNMANKGYDIGAAGRIFTYDDAVPASYAARISGNTGLFEKAAAELALESQTAINLYFTPVDEATRYLPITVDGHQLCEGDEVVDEATKATITRDTLEDGRIRVRISGIGPLYLNHAYKIVAGVPAVPMLPWMGGKVSEASEMTLEFSALSYAYAKQSDEGAHDLSMALYRYYKGIGLIKDKKTISEF